MKNSPNENPIAIYDLYDLWYEPFWYWQWFWPIVISCLVICVIIMVVFIIKKRKSKIVILDPWDQALQKLKLLDINEFKDLDMHKQFYSSITEILKQYFSQRYGLMLTSKTDEEVIALICTSEFPKSLHHSLREIFQGALYIKFANQDAALEKMHDDLNYSKSLVKGTIDQ